MSGLWFDPELDGEGFNLLEAEEGLVVTFYGYDNSGQRLWLISDVLSDTVEFDTTLDVAMLVGDNGNFQQPLPPSNLTEWGSLFQCTVANNGASRLSFLNDEALGIFDPSLDAAPGSDQVWLTYSTVSTSVQWPTQNAMVIQNRLAQSLDGGASFSFINEINPVLDVTIDLAPPNHAGTWVNEVSSLVYDAAAEPDQR